MMKDFLFVTKIVICRLCEPQGKNLIIIKQRTIVYRRACQLREYHLKLRFMNNELNYKYVTDTYVCLGCQADKSSDIFRSCFTDTDQIMSDAVIINYY